MKDKLFAYLEEHRVAITCAADFLFDHPEQGHEEFKALEMLTGLLRDNGFVVETGVADLETAFRAQWQNGEGGPTIGLLCEYDALPMGHACGHHMQGPSIIWAAIALKELYQDRPYTLVVYGTPAEETVGGKITMLEHNCFKELDVSLMMHASPTTCTDVACIGAAFYTVTFSGKSAHAALAPDQGRSALDALLLCFQGVEFMREHVREDTRMHYTVLDAGGPANIVSPKAMGSFVLRSYNSIYLEAVEARFCKIVEGAALMTETEFEIKTTPSYLSKVPVIRLNDALMDNAKLVGAPRLSPPREKTGSTDFGNVTFHIPGSCIRVGFVPEGTSSHSQEYLDAGKSEEAHNATMCAAKILAATAYDIVADTGLLTGIKEEFAQRKAAMKR